MSEEFTYSTYEVDQIVAKKDAEIDQLLLQLENLDGDALDAEKQHDREIATLKSLITELADWIKGDRKCGAWELTKKAREAVK
jgi:signal transduction histidine kinase